MENLVSDSFFSGFFKNKKVFITGHTGFKGAWLSATLHLLGARVKGYALEPEQPNGVFDYLQPLGIQESIIDDIRNKERLEKELLDFEPDIIFHLAAQPLVRRSYEKPAETFEINVAGTANLLESAIRLKKKCAIIVITTDKVYHNKEQDILYKEEDILGGYDPYSASKACTELVADSFRNSFFNHTYYDRHRKSLATVRAGNVIGGGDWSKDRIIPDIVGFLQRNEPVLLRSPMAVRPWQHVLEAIAGYLVLASRLYEHPSAFSRAFNFGPVPEDHLAVKDLVEKAIAVWGAGSWQDVSDKGQPHEAGLLKLDITKAQKALEWKPKLSVNEAIRWTINWYQQPDAHKMDYTFQQIKDYFRL